MPVIKRYPNRKLYDTEAKRYVTLNEIADLIRSGQDIQVLDYESGQDLTTLVLSQVILEQERQQSGFLPRSLLSELVRAGGSRVSKIQRRLASTFDWWEEFDGELRRRFDALVEKGEMGVQEADSLLGKLRALGGTKFVPSAEETEERLAVILEERDIPTRSELQALMEQLDALAAQLDAIQKAKAAETPPSTPQDEA